MNRLNRHRKRPIRFAELWEYHNWKMKIYTIDGVGNGVEKSYVDIAREIAMKKIPVAEDHHFSGFLTIHVAPAFNQIIFDYWAKENELRHLVFKAEAASPKKFTDITAFGEAFCVWELKVIGFERDRWMEHIAGKHEAPDFQKYYASTLNIDE